MKIKLSRVDSVSLSFTKSSSTYFAFCEALSCMEGCSHIIIRYEHFDRSIYVTSDRTTIDNLFTLMNYFI